MRYTLFQTHWICWDGGDLNKDKDCDFLAELSFQPVWLLVTNSRAITRKAVEYDGCPSYIGTSIDLPLSLTTALSATIFEASRVNAV